jgi:predicted HNH restriction endonuclease
MSRNSDVPSADRYAVAFQQLEETGKLLPRHKALLAAHYSSAAVTDAQLSSRVRWKEGSANLHYGRLAEMVCKELDFDAPDRYKSGKPLWISAIAIVSRDGSEGRYRWQMRPQVAKALEKLGWVQKAPRTILLLWNPDRTDLDYDRVVRATESGKPFCTRWSMGKRKDIAKGDRVFFARTGADRGIVGAGHTTSLRLPDKPGYRKNRVRVSFDTLLSPEEALPIKELVKAKIDGPWKALRASGLQVPSESATAIEELWHRHLKKIGRSSSRRATEDPVLQGEPAEAPERRYYSVNTDGAHSKSEEYMLRKHRAAAFYKPWMYKIDDIKKGDIVFLYQNEVGIIAVGKASGRIAEEPCIHGKHRDPKKGNKQHSIDLLDFKVVDPPIPAQEIREISEDAEGIGVIVRGTVVHIRPGTGINLYRRAKSSRLPSLNSTKTQEQINAVLEGNAYPAEAMFRKRNRALIDAAKRQSDGKCCVCGFSFVEEYAGLTNGCLVAHHVKPIGKRKRATKTKLDDIDLLCPNCHTVVHTEDPPLTAAKLRTMLAR